MKVLLVVLAIVIAVLALPMLLPAPTGSQGSQAVSGLPWQIESLPDGTTRVFGLNLGASTLDDARGRFGKDGEIAIVAAPGEAGTLEVYYPDVTLGAVTGKLIVTADLPDDTLAAMRQRTRKTEYMQSSTKKARLNDADLPVAYAARIRALAFVPSANLDEQMVLQRFGQPRERIPAAEHTEHFLYPERGLDVVLDSEGKELIQYVAPRDFARLREPLIQNNADKASPR
jgi:hypothetical protein